MTGGLVGSGRPADPNGTSAPGDSPDVDTSIHVGVSSGGDAEGADAELDPAAPSRIEWLIALAVVVGAAFGVGYLSRGMWFYSDVWDFLALRSITDIESLLRPHFGHWQVPAAIQGRIMYAISGMDYWPVHQIGRALGWGVFSLCSWWLMRRRGADSVVSLGVLVIISVLGTSFYFQASHVGALIAIGSVIAAAVLIENEVEPTTGDRAKLFGLLLLAVMSAGIGVASMPGVGLGLLLIGRLRRWLMPIAGVAAVYVGWFVALNVSSEDATEPVRSVLEIPMAFARNVANVLVALTGLPSWAGWPLLILALAGLAYLAINRRLTPAQVVLLSCAIVYLVLVARSRFSVSRAPVATNVTLMLLPVFIPVIRVRRTMIRGMVVVVFAALFLSHAVRLESGLDERIALSTEGRRTVETMAHLIGEGEAFDGTFHIRDLTSSSQLTLNGLARLVDEGWSPGARGDVDEAAFRLRVSLIPPEPGVRNGSIEVVEGRLRADACAIALDGAPVVLSVVGPTSVTYRVSPSSDVTIAWAGAGTPGAGHLGWTTFTDVDVHLYGSSEGATVTFEAGPESDRLVVCGLAPHLASS